MLEKTLDLVMKYTVLKTYIEQISDEDKIINQAFKKISEKIIAELEEAEKIQKEIKEHKKKIKEKEEIRK